MSADVKTIMKERASNQETVKVVVRCRPLSTKEMQAGHGVICNMDTKTGAIFLTKPGVDEAPK